MNSIPGMERNTGINSYAPMNSIPRIGNRINYAIRRDLVDTVRGTYDGADESYKLDDKSFIAGMMYMKGITDGMKMAKIYGEGASHLDGIVYGKGDIYGEYSSKGSSGRGYASGGKAYAGAGKGASYGGKGTSYGSGKGSSGSSGGK